MVLAIQKSLLPLADTALFTSFLHIIYECIRSETNPSTTGFRPNRRFAIPLIRIYILIEKPLHPLWEFWGSPARAPSDCRELLGSCWVKAREISGIAAPFITAEVRNCARRTYFTNSWWIISGDTPAEMGGVYRWNCSSILLGLYLESPFWMFCVDCWLLQRCNVCICRDVCIYVPCDKEVCVIVRVMLVGWLGTRWWQMSGLGLCTWSLIIWEEHHILIILSALEGT